MTEIKDILQYLIDNRKMPNVEVENKPKYAKSNIGKVSQIQTHDFFGETVLSVSVYFDGCFHNTWFHDAESEDGRCRYIKELKIV